MKTGTLQFSYFKQGKSVVGETCFRLI
jgi:hypothetical protein